MYKIVKFSLKKMLTCFRKIYFQKLQVLKLKFIFKFYDAILNKKNLLFLSADNFSNLFTIKNPAHEKNKRSFLK